MNTPSTRKPGLDLGKLSSVAKIAVNRRPQPADAEIELALIFSNSQVRKRFRYLEELAESMRLNGVIEPLLVHEEADGRYRVIVGERRLRAAPLAGLSKVPVLIKRGLTDLQVRRMQVAENNDRDDLSPFEEAMGVIEDVEHYGTREAMQIWNRGEAWISKRVGVRRYPEPVRALLEEDLCGDFEVLHCLKQLHEAEGGRAVFEELDARLRQGGSLSREEARDTLARLRAWNRQQAAGQEVPETVSAPAASGPIALDDKEAARDGLPVSGEGAGERLQTLRAELRKRGKASGVRFAEMQDKMQVLGYALEQTDWVCWEALLGTVLPVLETLGTERSQIYLKKLQRELKRHDPLELLQAQGGLDEAPEDWGP